MNNDEKNQEKGDPISAETEARIVAWASGEASAPEAAELGRLAAENPEAAAFKARIDRLRGHAAEAESADREPLRLSAARRAELLEEISGTGSSPARAESSSPDVPALSQIPILMRRMNLAFAAVFSIVLIAGVTWWGEQTHFRAPARTADAVIKGDSFTVKPDNPVPVEVDDAPPKVKWEVAPPSLPDAPAKPAIKDFVEPIEPPRPAIDIHMVKIPADPGPGGGHDILYKLSELDQAPLPKYQARPVYPSGMRQAGISGEVTVDFVVDPSGDVRNAVAVHSSQREFEDSACYAIARWKFKPGRKDGRAVFVHMQVPVVFSLSSDGGP